MLKLSEFIVGDMAQTTGLVLSLRRTSYEYDALLFSQNDQRYALVLTDERDALHRVFPIDGHTDLHGLLIPGVSIECDETSLFDNSSYHAPLGSLVRRGSELNVQSTLVGNRLFPHGGLFTLLSDLPPCEINQTACFLKWQIVLGEGQDKRVLKKVEVASNKLG